MPLQKYPYHGNKQGELEFLAQPQGHESTFQHLKVSNEMLRRNHYGEIPQILSRNTAS